MLLKRIAWFVGFAFALALAICLRSLGFDWLKVIIVLLGTGLLFSFAISQVCAALPLRNASKKPPKVADYIERLEKHTPPILREFEKLHARFHKCVIDTSWLPADNQRMVEIRAHPADDPPTDAGTGRVAAARNVALRRAAAPHAQNLRPPSDEGRLSAVVFQGIPAILATDLRYARRPFAPP
jgi:hypothetical protein